MDDVSRATTDAMMRAAAAATGESNPDVKLLCECPKQHATINADTASYLGARRYLGEYDTNGLVTREPCARSRSNLLFLFRAWAGGASSAHVTSERWNDVKRRGAASIPRSLKTCVATFGILPSIRCKVAELSGQGVELGCAFLGVPKLMSSTSPHPPGAWFPGAFTCLSSCSGPEAVLLCAPVAETEWYCLSEQSGLTIDGLFAVDIMGCETQFVTPAALERGTRLQDFARARQEEFSAVVLVAAFRAEVERARRETRRAHLHNLNDYAEPSPFEWPTTEGRESQISLWILWEWRTSGAWQYALHNQQMNHILCRGVAVPFALKNALEEARVRGDDIGENALESTEVYELRAAAARALMREDESAAKRLILDMVAARCDDLDVVTDDGRTLKKYI